MDNLNDELLDSWLESYISHWPDAEQTHRQVFAQAKLANKSGGAEAVAIVGTQLSVPIIIGSQVTETDERKTAIFLKDVPVGTELYTHPSVAGMPDEPTEEMVEAAIATFGGIVGTPENLAKPEYVERMKDRQRKAVIEHYKAMHSAYVRALGGA